jgi:hypothetical protein
MSCVYEEEVQQAGIKNRWFEQPAGTTLFYITKYYTRSRRTTLSGAGRPVGALGAPLGSARTDRHREPRPGADRAGLLNPGDAHAALHPLVAQLFTTCATRTSSPSSRPRCASRTGPLHGQRQPDCAGALPARTATTTTRSTSSTRPSLPWVELINAFQFNGQVYGIFYAGVGAGSAIVGFVLWLLSRILTRLKHPPPFKFASFLVNTASSRSQRFVFLASVPVALAGLILQLWFVVLGGSDPLNRPTSVCLAGGLPGCYDTLKPTTDSVDRYRSGRIGHAWLVLAVYLLVYGDMLVVPSSRFNQRARDGELQRDTVVRQRGVVTQRHT